MDTLVFGRDRQIAELLELGAGAGATGSPGAVVMSAIDGMPGIGKTALAVHAGHLLAENFPDGQLLVHLNAHAADAPPRDPAEALGQILLTLGLDPRDIPADVDERAKVYRDRLASTRTLIVLDDAASEQQVRPLLPAAAGCLVLVTSRNRLKALDDAHPMQLDVLAAVDAIALFARYAGPGRISVDDPEVHQIVELCGYLPLALRITAANLRYSRAWSTEHLQRLLRAGLADLSAFDDGERQVAAAFDLSYNNLPTDQQTMFRRLGLIPGPDTDAYAAANIQDTYPAQADRLLQNLTGRSLLIETIPGRYRLHDLLRIHARYRAEHDDTGTDRNNAVDRLLDYYQHTAIHAYSYAQTGVPAPFLPEPAAPPRHVHPLNDRLDAETWLATELANLTAAARHAATRANPIHAVTLSAALSVPLSDRGLWAQACELHVAAAHAAHSLHNHFWQANALTDLFHVRLLAGDYSGAQDAQRQALALYQGLGDMYGQARSLTDLGRVRHASGDFSGAQDALQQALTLCRDLGDPLGEAGALAALGDVWYISGNYSGAQDALQRALMLYQNLGWDFRQGQANTLNDLGRLRELTGDYSGAQDALRQALALYQNLGAQLGKANALKNLARVGRRTGDYSGAQDALRQALAIYQDLDDRNGQGNALIDLGHERLLAGDYPGAQDAPLQALALYQDLGDRLGQANALLDIGHVRCLVGDYPGAEDALVQAMALYKDLDSQNGQANVLNHFGTLRRLTGDYPGAEKAHHQALAQFRALGLRANEAWALTLYAAVPLASGNAVRALKMFRDALTMTRELQQPSSEAMVLEGISECLLRTGNDQDGIVHLKQALEIYRRLGMQSGIQRVEVRLAKLSRRDASGAV